MAKKIAKERQSLSLTNPMRTTSQYIMLQTVWDRIQQEYSGL